MKHFNFPQENNRYKQLKGWKDDYMIEHSIKSLSWADYFYMIAEELSQLKKRRLR